MMTKSDLFINFFILLYTLGGIIPYLEVGILVWGVASLASILLIQHYNYGKFNNFKENSISLYSYP